MFSCYSILNVILLYFFFYFFGFGKRFLSDDDDDEEEDGDDDKSDDDDDDDKDDDNDDGNEEDDDDNDDDDNDCFVVTVTYHYIWLNDLTELVITSLDFNCFCRKYTSSRMWVVTLEPSVGELATFSSESNNLSLNDLP